MRTERRKVQWRQRDTFYDDPRNDRRDDRRCRDRRTPPSLRDAAEAMLAWRDGFVGPDQEGSKEAWELRAALDAEVSR